MSDLRTWLAGLSETNILRVSSPVELDHTGTALVVELEKQGRTPVVLFEKPADYDVPVLMNLFADRRRIAAMAGASPKLAASTPAGSMR